MTLAPIILASASMSVPGLTFTNSSLGTRLGGARGASTRWVAFFITVRKT